jgi:hypothetical protein
MYTKIGKEWFAGVKKLLSMQAPYFAFQVQTEDYLLMVSFYFSIHQFSTF